MISVFLAIAVDKLSEVRSLEEDTIEETEKMLERRKEREEQISALKNPNAPQVQRRTIRRVMRYLADNPSERVNQMKQRKKKQLAFQLDLKRGSSLINPPAAGYASRRTSGSYRRSTSAPINSEVNTSVTGSESESVPPSSASAHGKTSIVSQTSSPASTPRQRNPLRLMKRRSDYFDKQKMRLGGWLPSSASPSTQSSLTSSIESQDTSSIERKASRGQAASFNDDDSVFDDEGPSGRITERHFSVASTPEASKLREHPLMVSYERTQSYPGISTYEVEVSKLLVLLIFMIVILVNE